MLTMGCDVGSTSSKAVILKDGTEIIASKIVPLGTGTKGPAAVYQEVLDLAGVAREDLDMLVATGYGRLTFQGADKQVSELSCHARGVSFLNPAVRTLVDIGGQDLKALRVNSRGGMENFVMNDKCAAGTGRFLEVMAKILDVPIGELGELALKSNTKMIISNTCTVFAESEVVSHLSNGVPIEDIAAGIARSVANRAASLIGRVGVVDTVAISGGVSKNKGIVHFLSEELNTPVYVSEIAQLAGAIGAALFGYSAVLKQEKRE